MEDNLIMKNTAEVCLAAGVRSPQRVSVVMPCNVLVEEPAPYSPVYSELRFDVRERALQCVVGVGYSEVRIVICRPQVGHVALQAQIRTPEWPVGEMCLPGRLRAPF